MLSMYSVYIKAKSYYPQVFLEKNKHVVRKKRRHIFITDDIYSDDLMIIMILMKKLR